ncbi:DUF5131 family protein [Solidesulfovibrio magneticus]|uniref:Bacteriophage protein gp37 n=1 Tax=Solidesulfovibrio magneticus (strain ATCC 700980 / DSM 13731 / RS-1) TaxID=573370 RepID=C4XM39_SOLM1|nr:phage Gp37/Gp68 family protein [Solidesulfovibrio magneticus]BAH77167.1 hypothetical protein DMR_36760 [Solidesulfovibrio magneticus RS-1]
MLTNTKINWTEKTWNPVTGCTKISPGCLNCYAERMAHRCHCMGLAKYKDGFKLAIHPDKLDEPLKTKKPTMIFVNSMSDLFHKDVPLEFIKDVFAVMGQAGQHTFQVLTKRAERLAELAPTLTWWPNIWMGVTVERQEYLYRLDCLRTVPAAVRFTSFEPLLGPLHEINLDGIGWVIVGGESGPGARPMEPAWATDIRNQCLSKKVPFLFKQWGGVRKQKNGNLLDGREWMEYPLGK